MRGGTSDHDEMPAVRRRVGRYQSLVPTPTDGVLMSS
jgi:hypothetical protein